MASSPSAGARSRTSARRSPAARRSGGRTRQQLQLAKGKAQRFWTSFTSSALAAFTAVSCVLHPELLTPPTSTSASRPGAQAVGFDKCPGLFPGGRPPPMPSSSAWRELCFNSFAVLHNAGTKTPVFVVERLNKASLRAAQNQQRTDQFYPEARLPFSHRAQLEDYKGSGYARGHLAPAADMSSPQAMAQSFSLANIVPQDPAHNAGAWLKIEQDTRQYVKRARGDVFVFSGPVYSGRSRAIGPGRVAVPTHLFKLVYDASTGRAWAHWQANDPKARVTAPLSYADFVQKTGLRLLASAQAAHALP